MPRSPGYREAFGGKLINLDKVYHGISSRINIITAEDTLYKGIPGQFEAGRYHSWVIDPESLPECLEVTCKDDEGLIMGVRHRQYDVRGVQYHPESVLTSHGLAIIENWLSI